MGKRDDPEDRIRELERPLSDMAGKSEPRAAKGRYPRNMPAVTYGGSLPPGPRTTAGRRGRWILLAVVIVSLVALPAVWAVIVVIDAVIAGLQGGGSTTSAPSNTTSATTTQANQSLQALYQVLPQGFDSNNCSPVRSPNRHALATVECKQTPDPSSAPYAAFSLYPNATALASAFQTGINEDTITQCPDGNRPPTTWHTEAAPNVPAGTMFCGNYDGGPDLLWTNNSDLLEGDIQGPDLNALYQYWLTLTTAAK